MGYIDAHVHVWTSDTLHYPLAQGYRPEDMRPRTFTPEDLFQHTRVAGVDRVNLIQMSYYGFDNSYMLDMITAYPDVFVGTAVINPLGPRPEQWMRDLSYRRVYAFRIHPRLSRQPPERWLQPRGYERMFAAGARYNLAMSCLIEPNCLPELDRMCRRFPETPVIIDHICRIGMMGPIREEDVNALCAMARHPRVMVKIGAFYALGRKQPPYTDLSDVIRRVLQAFGARRCMWESDSPFQVQAPHTYLDSINLIRQRLPFLSGEDKQWLLQGTAEAFFFERRG